MKAIIVDDDAVAIKVLEQHLKKRTEIELLQTFTDPLVALRYISEATVDILFLDIHMPQINGLEFIKSIPYAPYVILITSSVEHALEAYEHHVVDYLVKPVSFERFNKAVSKCKQTRKPVLKQEESDILFVKTNNQVVKIEKPEILYIEADGDYVMLFTPSGKYIVNATMKELEDMLNKDQFVRIHRSYIVSKNKIEKIIDHKVLINTQKLPIGNAYKSDFYALLNII